MLHASAYLNHEVSTVMSTNVTFGDNDNGKTMDNAESHNKKPSCINKTHEDDRPTNAKVKDMMKLKGKTWLMDKKRILRVIGSRKHSLQYKEMKDDEELNFCNEEENKTESLSNEDKEAKSFDGEGKDSMPNYNDELKSNIGSRNKPSLKYKEMRDVEDNEELNFCNEEEKKTESFHDEGKEVESFDDEGKDSLSPYNDEFKQTQLTNTDDLEKEEELECLGNNYFICPVLSPLSMDELRPLQVVRQHSFHVNRSPRSKGRPSLMKNRALSFESTLNCLEFKTECPSPNLLGDRPRLRRDSTFCSALVAPVVGLTLQSHSSLQSTESIAQNHGEWRASFRRKRNDIWEDMKYMSKRFKILKCCIGKVKRDPNLHRSDGCLT